MQHLNFRLAVPLLAAALFTVSGCGGGSSGSMQANDSTELAISPPRLMQQLPVSGNVEGQVLSPVHVNSLTLIEEKRVGRTIFEYTYRANVLNNGPAIQAATLTLTAAGSGTTIVDGAIVIGGLAAGASVVANDTVTIRQDRMVPFDPNAFVWQVSTTVNPPPTPPDTVAGVDANGNGIRDDVETYIRSAYTTPALQNALLQVAAGLQMTATATTSAQRDAAETARLDAGLCLADRTSPALAGQLIAVIQGKQLDTPERVRVDFAFRDSLAGKTVPASAAMVTGGTCK